MPLPLFIGALFGKAAASAIAKGVAAKAGAAGAKGLAGALAHHKLARDVAGKLAEKVAHSGVDAAFSKKHKKDEKG